MEALWGTRLILAGHQNSCNFLTDQKLSLASSNLCSSENGLRLRRMSSPYRGPVCMSFLIPEQRLKKWSVVTRNIPLWQKGSEIRSSWTRRLQWTIQRSEQRKFKNKINPSLVKKKNIHAAENSNVVLNLLHCTSDEGTARNKGHKSESEKTNLFDASSTGDNSRDSHLWCPRSDLFSICSWSE